MLLTLARFDKEIGVYTVISITFLQIR